MAALTYDSAARRSLLTGEIFEIVRYRDLLRLLIANSIKTRYKRSALGIIWTLVNPMLQMIVLTIAFSQLFKATIIDYPVYILAGLIFWNFFAQTTTSAMQSLVWGGSLLKRIYIPRTMFAMSAAGNGLVNLGLAMIPLVLIMVGMGHPFRSALWFLPVAILLTAMFTLGVALFLSALAVFYVDVVDMYQIFLSAFFYLTPVMYPKEIFPANLVWFMNLNPLFHLLELFRRPIYLGVLPGPNTIAAATASAVVALAVGWWAFTLKEDEFAYRI